MNQFPIGCYYYWLITVCILCAKLLLYRTLCTVCQCTHVMYLWECDKFWFIFIILCLSYIRFHARSLSYICFFFFYTMCVLLKQCIAICWLAHIKKMSKTIECSIHAETTQLNCMLLNHSISAVLFHLAPEIDSRVLEILSENSSCWQISTKNRHRLFVFC